MDSNQPCIRNNSSPFSLHGHFPCRTDSSSLVFGHRNKLSNIDALCDIDSNNLYLWSGNKEDKINRLDDLQYNNSMGMDSEITNMDNSIDNYVY